VSCAPLPAGPWPAYASRSAESATASSANYWYPASNAVDGDLTTIWHSEFSGRHDPLPISLTVDLGRAQHVYGLTYQTRLDGTTTGTITGYQVQVSLDGATFSDVASGSWSDDSSLKSVTFAPCVARYVRLIATGGDNGYASAAEVNVATTS
jgi:alpha-galactosidase